MQDKAELKKQVIILAVILIVVIIFAIILNINKSNNIYTTNKKQQEATTNNVTDSQDEIMNNLKGLIETSNTNDEETKEQTIKDTISTGVSEEMQVNSKETIKYEETWYGDN